MNHVLIDTNAYSALMGGERDVLNIIADSDVVFVSIFVIGELLTGFKKGTKESFNSEILEKFLSRPNVRIVSATYDTSEFFASIKDNLRKSGHPVPINDIWIAAHCMETGSMLITYDKHFFEIPGLLIWQWGGLNRSGMG
jgi:tRNA(fMet)-specific endonuclease VapC